MFKNTYYNFWKWAQFLSALFIILVGLMMTWYWEIMISTRYLPKLYKTSWTVSIPGCEPHRQPFYPAISTTWGQWWCSGFGSFFQSIWGTHFLIQIWVTNSESETFFALQMGTSLPKKDFFSKFGIMMEEVVILRRNVPNCFDSVLSQVTKSESPKLIERMDHRELIGRDKEDTALVLPLVGIKCLVVLQNHLSKLQVVLCQNDSFFHQLNQNIWDQRFSNLTNHIRTFILIVIIF